MTVQIAVESADGADRDDLPEGWALTTLGEACQLNPRKPPRDALPVDAPVTFVPMAAVDDRQGAIATPLERRYGEVRAGYTAFAEGDVIFAKITPCMENGEAAIARGLTNELGFGSTEFHVLRPDGAAHSEYLYHYIRQESFRKVAEGSMAGAVGQLRVPASFLQQTSIPLPPLAEQRRIVEQVEALLARASTARERLAKLPAILKRFRQAVLAAACSGRLTAEWREDHPDCEPAGELIERTRAAIALRHEETCERARKEGRRRPSIPNALNAAPPPGDGLEELPLGWAWTTFDQVSEDITVGHVGLMVREYAPDGIPFLRSLNVRELRFDPTDLKFIRPAFHQQLAKSVLRPGDVVVVRSGNPGTACVIPDSLPEANCSDLVVVRPSAALDSHYAALFINSPATRAHIDETKVGIAQGHFNVGFMRVTPLPLPPLAEQHEIVRRVEALFKLADAIEQRVARAAASAEKLTQAILAKAFRGELVPTEAELARREGRDYEPASALLERIRRERLAIGVAGSPRRRGGARGRGHQLRLSDGLEEAGS